MRKVRGRKAVAQKRAPLAASLEPSVASPLEALQLQEFLEGIDEGVLAVDPAWRILYLNAGGERLLGKPRQEFLGQELWSALPAWASTSFAETWRRAMARQEPAAREDARLVARAVPSAHGLTLFLREVTEPREVAQALHERRRSEERMARLHALT